MAECHIHNILNTSLFRVTRRPRALLQADAELRTEGSSYRPRSAYTRTALHRTGARLPPYSSEVESRPAYLFCSGAYQRNSPGPLRTLHQRRPGDRRGPLRATADWRGTDSDLDRATARCSAHQTDSMTGNGRPSTLRKPPTTPAAKLPMVRLSLVLVESN